MHFFIVRCCSEIKGSFDEVWRLFVDVVARVDVRGEFVWGRGWECEREREVEGLDVKAHFLLIALFIPIIPSIAFPSSSFLLFSYSVLRKDLARTCPVEFAAG